MGVPRNWGRRTVLSIRTTLLCGVCTSAPEFFETPIQGLTKACPGLVWGRGGIVGRFSLEYPQMYEGCCIESSARRPSYLRRVYDGLQGLALKAFPPL